MLVYICIPGYLSPQVKNEEAFTLISLCFVIQRVSILSIAFPLLYHPKAKLITQFKVDSYNISVKHQRTTKNDEIFEESLLHERGAQDKEKKTIFKEIDNGNLRHIFNKISSHQGKRKILKIYSSVCVGGQVTYQGVKIRFFVTVLSIVEYHQLLRGLCAQACLKLLFLSSFPTS
jgi:hypothetical protein